MEFNVTVFRSSFPDEFSTDVVVLIDTHNFTTTVSKALQNGATGVKPLSGGETNVEADLIGTDDSDDNIDNHPKYMTENTVSGKQLALETTNGSKAVHSIRASIDYEELVLCSLINCKAIAEYISRFDDILTVIAGVDGNPSPEDTFTAMYLYFLCQNPSISYNTNVINQFYNLMVNDIYSIVYEDETKFGVFGTPEKHANQHSSKVDTCSIVPIYDKDTNEFVSK